MTDTTNTTAAKHYAKRDPESQGAHYINHVYAITTEGLHATRRTSQLAHSDIEIERLRAALATPARVVYSRSMDLVRTFWQQHTESDALSMTMAELHDDVELVIRAARKPLADGVLHALYADVMTGRYADGLHYWRGTPAHRFARAIEQAHGITAAQKGGQDAEV